MKGNWAVTKNDNYQIAIRATSNTTFAGRYITINNNSVLEGSVKGDRIVVQQRYGDGRHYAAYDFNSISSKRLSGFCVDIYNANYNPIWEKLE